jgi:hypothetical protein
MGLQHKEEEEEEEVDDEEEVSGCQPSIYHPIVHILTFFWVNLPSRLVPIFTYYTL